MKKFRHPSRPTVWAIVCALCAALALLRPGAFASGSQEAKDDPHASVSNTGAAITVTLSKAPEQQPPHQPESVTLSAPPPVTPLPAPPSVDALAKEKQQSLDDLAKKKEGPFTWFGLAVLREKRSEEDIQDIIGEHKEITAFKKPAFPEQATASIRTREHDCSGWLYGPDILLTAGHCVYDHGNWVTEVEVIPGRSQAASEPFGHCGAKALYSTVGWTAHKDERYDYGAIRLDCQVGEKTGWLGYGWTNEPLKATPLTLIAYSTRHVSLSPGDVKDETSELLFYDNDTVGEWSGGAVIAPALCKACAIGVHTTGLHGTDPPHTSLNHGGRITREVYQNMQAWKHAP